MNQHDPKHYYFERQDPFKHGYWEDDFIVEKGEIIAAICFILCIALVGSFLFM